MRTLEPIVRDIVLLAAGTGLFVWEGVQDGRVNVMLFAMVMALGPAFMASFLLRTPGNGSQASTVSDSPPPSSLPSSQGETL